MATPSNTVKDMKSLVIEADKNWPKDSVNPKAYEFSRGREFYAREAPNQAYTWKP
jgi:hypothetical protein